MIAPADTKEVFRPIIPSLTASHVTVMVTSPAAKKHVAAKRYGSSEFDMQRAATTRKSHDHSASIIWSISRAIVLMLGSELNAFAQWPPYMLMVGELIAIQPPKQVTRLSCTVHEVVQR